MANVEHTVLERLNPAFMIFFFLSTLALLLCLLVTFTRLAILSSQYGISSLQSYADWSSRLMLTFHGKLLEDAALLAASSSSSFLLLARVLVGPCLSTSQSWPLQECNPMLADRMIPVDQLLLSAIVLVVMQVFMKGSSHSALQISWAVQIIITNTCLSLVNVDCYHWVAVNTPLICIMFLSYELERLLICRFIEEKSAQESTKKLFELELVIANDKIKECTRDLDAKRSMVRHISHEIRTPLNTVSIGIEVLKHELFRLMDQLPDTTIELVDGVKEACGAALIIVNELLAFERIAAGLAVVELATILIIPFVKDTVKEFFIPSLAKGVTLEVLPSIFDSKSTVVYIDPVKMAYVLRNFLSNALKFTQPGGYVKVSLTQSQSKLENVSCVLISVEDNGAGLSAINILKLFQEGVQFNANRLQGGGGSGFGLFIAKGMSDLHKGCSVWATSPGEGMGCTFYLEVPLKHLIKSSASIDSILASHVNDTESPTTKEDTIVQIESLNILVVDDSAPSRKVLAQLLSIAGHSCTQADDGLAAVSEISLMLLKKNGHEMYTQYDAVLMDSRMPKMNGPEATAAMRGLGFTGAIIAISGHDDRTEFDAAGADEVMMKPVSLSQITESLHIVMKDKKEKKNST